MVKLREFGKLKVKYFRGDIKDRIYSGNLFHN